jgi:hypothetical protein
MKDYRTIYKVSYTLSVIIAILAGIASAGGIFVKNLYRDNSLVSAAYQGNDIVTLFLAVPLMIISMTLSRRGSEKALLVWIGTMGYMLYNYIFYLYGANFNVLFLVYVALFTLSIYALIFSISKINAGEISRKFSTHTPVKFISGFLMFFGVLLGVLWIALSLSFVFTGKVPPQITQTDHPTGVVFASDLSLLIPAVILSSVLLWKRHAWGYVLGIIVMVKAITYGLALIVMCIFAYIKADIMDSFIGLWIFLTAGCMISTWLLMGNMKTGNKRAISM